MASDGWALKNEWRRDIRECDGCHTEQYALPRYQKGTGVFRGYFCEPCEQSRTIEQREARND